MAERQYAGAGWVKAALKVDDMSPLGETVADLLGDVFLGVYHLDRKRLAKVDWGNDCHIEFVYRGHLATVDDSMLTVLVVLAHDRMLRVAVEGKANGYLELTFHQRKNRDGQYHERHPFIEQHIAKIRAHYAEAVRL